MTAIVEWLRRPSISNSPPTQAEMRRNDLATILWFVFILFLGFGIRNNALSAGTQTVLGDNLLTVTLPARWAEGSALAQYTSGSAQSDAALSGGALSGDGPTSPTGFEQALPGQDNPEPLSPDQNPDSAAPTSDTVAVWNPRSPSLFDATIEVHARPLRPGENLNTARAALGVRRSQDLLRYRELQAEPITAVNLVPGMRITYAFVADPTRASGASAPPVVVQGQDVLFVYRGHLIRVSVAADATHWDAEAPAFDIVFDSLQIRSPQAQSPQIREALP